MCTPKYGKTHGPLMLIDFKFFDLNCVMDSVSFLATKPRPVVQLGEKEKRWRPERGVHTHVTLTSERLHSKKATCSELHSGFWSGAPSCRHCLGVSPCWEKGRVLLK